MLHMAAESERTGDVLPSTSCSCFCQLKELHHASCLSETVQTPELALQRNRGRACARIAEEMDDFFVCWLITQAGKDILRKESQGKKCCKCTEEHLHTFANAHLHQGHKAVSANERLTSRMTHIPSFYRKLCW
ncbi:uncharacterized protein LOC112982762 [Dromaius novaehollandiae]|uniref:uncharacterized protein LOC112982762 n=1 Tax=Dromaius novaehollandiae TaxID=8790 RepID=UPI0031200E65